MRGIYGKSNFMFKISERDGIPVTGHMVRLKVFACGVCGSDLHLVKEMEDWTPLGHEISAEVVEIGENVSKVAVGDTVICEDVAMCGSCYACKSGKPWLCRSGYTLDGQPGMSDELVVHENMLDKYSGIDPITATLVEPLAVAIRSVDRLDLDAMSTVAVFGMGAVGLLIAGYAKLKGAKRVVLIAHRRGSIRNKEAEKAAALMGITEFYYTEEADYREKAVSEGLFDHAVVCAPPQLASEALGIVGYGGVVTVLGISYSEKNSITNINVSDMVFNKKQLMTSIAEPAEKFPTSIELIRSGRLNVSGLITDVVKMDDVEKVKTLYANDCAAIKTVIVCNELK